MTHRTTHRSRTRRNLTLAFLWGGAALATGCTMPVLPGQTLTSVRPSYAPAMGVVRAEPYDGPKARIAVGDFQVKAVGATQMIGDGLREMLLTSLFGCDRFIVLERQAIQDVILEQDFGASGRVNPDTAAAVGELEGAELLVYGVVSEFREDASGGGLSIAVPSLPLTFGGGAKNSHVAIDLRIVDTSTGRLLYAGSVEGKAADYDARLSTRIGGGSSEVPVALSGYQGTPMEKAVRACIDTAIAEIATRTPKEYFRF